VIVRDARIEDAEAGTELIRESIRQLCAADHNNDPAAIAAWVANKTAAEFRRWLATPPQSLLVAESGGLAGVGLMGDDGELWLLYVDPRCILKGVGRALLGALEARARLKGACEVALDSTRTALGFYLSAGYAPSELGALRLTKRL